MNAETRIKILLSALSSNIFSSSDASLVVSGLIEAESADCINLQGIARTFHKPQLLRQIRTQTRHSGSLQTLKVDGSNIIYGSANIGRIQVLYKSPLPGELQARLAVESAIDRFLEYLLKKYQIVVLSESDCHVQVFIPGKKDYEFKRLWEEFLENIAFSVYGDPKLQIYGLRHSFVIGINAIKLAKKETGGFGVLQIPVVTKDQAIVLVAWYFSILKDRLKRDKLTPEQIQKLIAIEVQWANEIKEITKLLPAFNKISKSQINPTNNNINRIFDEIDRLLSLDVFDPLPSPLLSLDPGESGFRSAGDDTGKFCYSCGTSLGKHQKGWKTIRLTFEASTQRLQSSNSEKQPKICSSCLCLSFISPIKSSHRNIVVKVKAKSNESNRDITLRDYLRLLANKESRVTSGKFIMFPSEIIQKGKDRFYVSSKLGQIQYALAKVASIFPQEVLTDFKFRLVLQGSEIDLPSRHLLFIKGLMESYGQSIITGGKEINMGLGEAIRYIQQDLPYLADYSLVKIASISNRLKLEQTRSIYWEEIKEFMDSNSQLSKRAKLYQDVAALTGLTLAFVNSLERTAEKSLEQQKDLKYAAREVSKIIEKSDDATAFCYYATLGDTTKESVQARLYHNPGNDFIYSQTLALLEELEISSREDKDGKGGAYIQLYADDVSKAYMHFANQKDYSQDKDWKELTYNLKLSLYTRFPELVRKLKSTSEK